MLRGTRLFKWSLVVTLVTPNVQSCPRERQEVRLKNIGGPRKYNSCKTDLLYRDPSITGTAECSVLMSLAMGYPSRTFGKMIALPRRAPTVCFHFYFLSVHVNNN